MKKFRKLWLTVILFGAGVMVGSMTLSSSANGLAANQPGSVDDPLITKSYFEKHIKSLVQAELGNPGSGNLGTGSVDMDEIKSEIKKEVAKELQKAGASGLPGLIVVEMKPGESLYASAGTEFIVRNGKAVTISSKDGIPDVTAGKDLPNNTVITNNHLLLFPREDGRGIKPHQEQKDTIFVMVRGAYLHLDVNGAKID